MQVIEVLDKLATYARFYREDAVESVKRNSHMNEATGNTIDQKDVDALLVDFINYIASRHGVDYAMYVEDLSGK